MNDIPPWLNWLVTVLIIPATIALWRWWERRDAMMQQRISRHVAEDDEADTEIRRAMLTAFTQQTQQWQRITDVLDAQMRAIVALQFGAQERDRVLRAIYEEQQKMAAVWSVFAPEIFGRRRIDTPPMGPTSEEEQHGHE